MSNPFDFFESLSFKQIVDDIFHSDESQKNVPEVGVQKEEKPISKAKRVFKGKNRGISSTKLAKYVKELIECLRPTQQDSITLNVTQLKSFLQPYFPPVYKENLDRRIYDVLVIMKSVDVISGPKKEIRITKQDHYKDLVGVSYVGKEYDEKAVCGMVKQMSIEDPNIADILKPMDWFKKSRAVMPSIKSAKERFDDFMRSEDLSYLVDKPKKKLD